MTVTEEMTADEVYLTFAQARRKYVELEERTFKHDPILMKQMIRKRDPNLFLTKVNQLLGKAQWSTDSNNDLIPQKALAIYFDLSPKSTLKAFKTFVSKFQEAEYTLNRTLQNHIDELENCQSLGELVDTHTNWHTKDIYHSVKRIEAMLLSSLHQSRSQKVLTLIDVDVKNEDLLWNMENQIHLMTDMKPVWITETRGGYHMLYQKEANRYIFQGFRDVFAEEIKRGDIELPNSGREVMTPVPGVMQGGFITREVKL